MQLKRNPNIVDVRSLDAVDTELADAVLALGSGMEGDHLEAVRRRKSAEVRLAVQYLLLADGRNAPILRDAAERLSSGPLKRMVAKYFLQHRERYVEEHVRWAVKVVAGVRYIEDTR